MATTLPFTRITLDALNGLAGLATTKALSGAPYDFIGQVHWYVNLTADDSAIVTALKDVAVGDVAVNMGYSTSPPYAALARAYQCTALPPATWANWSDMSADWSFHPLPAGAPDGQWGMVPATWQGGQPASAGVWKKRKGTWVPWGGHRTEFAWIMDDLLAALRASGGDALVSNAWNTKLHFSKHATGIGLSHGWAQWQLLSASNVRCITNATDAFEIKRTLTLPAGAGEWYYSGDLTKWGFKLRAAATDYAITGTIDMGSWDDDGNGISATLSTSHPGIVSSSYLFTAANGHCYYRIILDGTLSAGEVYFDAAIANGIQAEEKYLAMSGVKLELAQSFAGSTVTDLVAHAATGDTWKAMSVGDDGWISGPEDNNLRCSIALSTSPATNCIWDGDAALFAHSGVLWYDYYWELLAPRIDDKSPSASQPGVVDTAVAVGRKVDQVSPPTLTTFLPGNAARSVPCIRDTAGEPISLVTPWGIAAGDLPAGAQLEKPTRGWIYAITIHRDVNPDGRFADNANPITVRLGYMRNAGGGGWSFVTLLTETLPAGQDHFTAYRRLYLWDDLTLSWQSDQAVRVDCWYTHCRDYGGHVMEIPNDGGTLHDQLPPPFYAWYLDLLTERLNSL